MARLDRATQYPQPAPVIAGSPGLAFGSPEDDKTDYEADWPPAAGA
jgi:hypothetical protein